jgi:hypothetical protein
VTLLALVWLDIYFVPSDWLFETPQGARLLETLAAAVFPAL